MMELPPSDSASLYPKIAVLEAARTPFVLVILVEALGSTPQDTGAKMLVTPTGLHAGTVGGGRVEAKAIALAQELLKSSEGAVAKPHFVSWTLKGDVGMTCGGSVKLYFEPHPGEASAWSIAIFGSGHITQALVPVLQPLPCSINIFDTRAEWLGRISVSSNVCVNLVPDLAPVIDSLPPRCFVLCMTQGHSTDRPILSRALKTRTFPYLGCIGSESKAAILRKELVADGLSPESAQHFFCPVGLELGTNHPHEIALSIAAQLVLERDRTRPSDSAD